MRIESKIMQNWKYDISTPLVSICCATYNHENYIAEAIESFLIQETNFPFEILIRDDSSTDKTAKIIQKYAQKYPLIIHPIYEEENTYSKGIRPMQELFKVAKGKYIALCEGDDYWTDSLKLQKQVDFLEKNDEYVIVYSDIQAFDLEGDLEKNYGGAKRDLEAIELQKCTPLSSATVCFRNCLKDFPVEIQCSKFGDLFLWSILGEYGKGKYLKDIKLTKYRVHEGGVFSKKTEKTRQEMWFFTTGALCKYYNRIGNKELANYFQIKNLTTSIMIIGLFPLLKIFLIKTLRYIFKKGI